MNNSRTLPSFMRSCLRENDKKFARIKYVYGFTLLEILIALFVFSIISVILTTTLHNVIGFQARTESHAERLRQLQMTLLIMSRDIEQAINRPVMNASGKEEPALVGSKQTLTFTHTGIANPLGTAKKSTLQRVTYQWKDGFFSRITYDALDKTPESKSHTRHLPGDVTDVHFLYLDKNGRFRADWPVSGLGSQELPRAVKVTLTILNWGKVSQLYVIAAGSTKTIEAPIRT